MLTVVMPVLIWSEYTDRTLESLIKNANTTGSYVDELIILVDGNDETTIKKAKDFFYEYKQSIFKYGKCIAEGKKVGVNALRNRGIREAKNDHIFIVNDDILLTYRWDTTIDMELENEAVVCPKFHMGNTPFGGLLRSKPDNIAGHARGLNRRHRSNIGEIPKSLNIRYGDDWVFRRCIDLGKPCKRLEYPNIHHFVSKTVYNPQVWAEVQKITESDKRARIEICKLQGRIDERYL